MDGCVKGHVDEWMNQWIETHSCIQIWKWKRYSLSLVDSLQPLDCSPPGSSVLGISRQEYCSGLPFPSLEDLPYPGIEPQVSRIAGRFHCPLSHKGIYTNTVCGYVCVSISVCLYLCSSVTICVCLSEILCYEFHFHVCVCFSWVCFPHSVQISLLNCRYLSHLTFCPVSPKAALWGNIRESLAEIFYYSAILMSE